MRVAIAGGTGLVGRLVVVDAEARGHEVVVLARSRGVDLTTGAGLDDALRGAQAVIDVTNVGTTRAGRATAFFGTTTRALLAGEERAGVGRHVALSIVGVDRAPVGYYAGKRAQEVLVESGPVPWAVLRATQLHEFAGQVHAAAAVGPLHLAPTMRTQPVAAREVASRLVDLVEPTAPGGYVELAGPREESLVDMVRRWARASGRRGWTAAVPLPGALGRAQRDGTLLPGDGAETGTETFDAWLRRTTG